MKYSCLVALCCVVAGVSGCGRPVEIIAHRGASHLAPENTMAAVELAWEQGVDVEVDVHLSGDGEIVVIHDATTRHITGTELEVAGATVAELRELDYGGFKGPEYAGEPIPLLSDVLAGIPAGRKLYVEIKCGPEILPVLQRRISQSGMASRVVIIGFDLETVAAAKRLLGLPTYWLVGTKKTEETEEWIPHDPALVATARERGLDGLDVHYAGLSERFVQAATEAGQKLYVWTVDKPEVAVRMARMGVAGITTNRPAWLRSQIAGQVRVAGP